MGKDLKGKELGQGILQRKNGVYEARYTDRFGKRKSISGKNLKEVKLRFNEAIYENAQEINIKEDIKLDNWFEKWMDIYKDKTIKENTKSRYTRLYYKHISPQLGNFYLKDISQLNVRQLIKHLDNMGLRHETQNTTRIMLVDMFNKAINNDLMKKNPARGVSVKEKDNEEVRVLTVEEQILFFDCCKGTFYDNFFNVAITTGLRIGELAALRWEDIDWDKKVIHVTRTLVYQKYLTDEKKEFHFELPKTRTSLRDVPINELCEKALKKQYIQKNIVADKAPKSKQPAKDFQDLLFTTSFNTPLNPQIVCDAIKRIVDEINKTRDTTEEINTFSCHCFRHTFATRCFEAGIKPKTVQTILGHATLQMTMDLYTSVLSEHQTSEIEKLDEKLNEINTMDYANIDEKIKTQTKSR